MNEDDDMEGDAENNVAMADIEEEDKDIVLSNAKEEMEH
jgi:hypothetical protein